MQISNASAARAGEEGPAGPATAAATATAARGPGRASAARAVLDALRPHQWVKNLLLALPLFLAHEIQDARKAAAVGFAIVAFCACASAGYVINDLRDRASDRAHPTKRARPFAANRLSAGAGAGIAAALLVVGFSVAALLVSPALAGMLGVYVAATITYSLWLKTRLLIDVFVLAGLYAHRILSGGVAAGVPVTPWLMAFSLFFFLSLAFAKRYAELARLRDGGAETRAAGRPYHVEDLDVIASVGPASGYLAVLVLALYINNSQASVELYREPGVLWLACPVLLYWITRVWFLARRRALHEDPVLFALKDRASLTAAALTCGLIVVASGWDCRGARTRTNAMLRSATKTISGWANYPAQQACRLVRPESMRDLREAVTSTAGMHLPRPRPQLRRCG